MTTTTKPLTPAETERFSWIMGSSGTMFSWWQAVEFHGGDWQTPSDITFTVEDPDDEEKELGKRVTARNIVRAFGTARRLHLGKDFDHENLDAPAADIVLQIAVLGSVVYA